VVREFPEDFLVAIDLKGVSTLALLASEKVANHKVAVMQAPAGS
jgi:hypothetical protein